MSLRIPCRSVSYVAPYTMSLRHPCNVRDPCRIITSIQHLIPPNPRTVLTKLPAYRDPEKQVKATLPPPVPPTPRNSAAMLRKVRQAQLLLQRKDEDLDRKIFPSVYDKPKSLETSRAQA